MSRIPFALLLSLLVAFSARAADHANLALELFIAPRTPAAPTLDFHPRVRNLGPDAATNVVLRFSTSEGSPTFAVPGCTPSGDGQCTIAILPAGEDRDGVIRVANEVRDAELTIDRLSPPRSTIPTRRTTA